VVAHPRVAAQPAMIAQTGITTPDESHWTL